MKLFTKYNLSFLMFSLFAMAPFVASAQVERLPGVIDRDIPNIEMEIKKSGKPLEPSPDFVKPADSDTPLGKFDRVEFSGMTVIDENILREAASPYLGRTINKGELAELKFKLTQIYYEKGFILVKVVTPPQNLKGRVLKIDVYEAEIGKININDPDGILNEHVSKQFADRLEESEIFHENKAESLVSDINDLKNIAATLNLRPGKKFKTTDLDVFISEANEDSQYVSFDNYGSVLTGRRIGTAHLEKSNLFHFGETLSADIKRSEDDLFSFIAGVTTPIGFKNIMLEAKGIYSKNDIGDRLASLDAKGKTKMLSVAFSRNLVNTRNLKTTVRAGFEARNHKSTLASVLDTKDDIRQTFIDGSYLRKVDGGIFYGSARLSKGVDAFGASKKGQTNATRSTGDPEAIMFEPLILVNFRPDLIPGVPFINGEIKAIATGQVASATLLSSDLFVIGGYGSVRGFPVAQETGESGYQFSVEYNHIIDLHEDWSIKAGPFIDGGTVYNKIDGSTEDDHIYSTGLGIEATTDLVPDGDTSFRFDVAHPIGAYKSQEVDNSVIYFSMRQSF